VVRDRAPRPDLSRAALSYGAALGIRDPAGLGRRLYDYGRFPASPRLRRAFPTPESVGDHLLHENEALRRQLMSGWRRRRFAGEDVGWALWTRPRGDPRDGKTTHKLYASPVLDQVRPVFHAVMPIVTESDAVGFKVGAELPYLGRPDKLVFYFAGKAEMDRVAGLLEPRLAEFEPHGVPFTCAIGDGGMLSWGMDPPGKTDTSWRSWLALQLARAMTEAEPDRAVDAALERTAALGVDPVTWEPLSIDWERDGPK
jgi:hypothetical protein